MLIPLADGAMSYLGFGDQWQNLPRETKLEILHDMGSGPDQRGAFAFVGNHEPEFGE
jgi:hypothetical protein